MKNDANESGMGQRPSGPDIINVSFCSQRYESKCEKVKLGKVLFSHHISLETPQTLRRCMKLHGCLKEKPTWIYLWAVSFICVHTYLQTVELNWPEPSHNIWQYFVLFVPKVMIELTKETFKISFHWNNAHKDLKESLSSQDRFEKILLFIEVIALKSVTLHSF